MSLPLFLAALLATTLVVVLTRRRVQRNASLSGARWARRAPAGDRASDRTEDELRSVLIELERLARDLNAQIDTRYRKLDALLRHADRRIAELKGLTRETVSEGSRSVDVLVGEPGTRGNDPPASLPSRRERVYALVEEGRSPQDIAKALGRPVGEIELILELRRQGLTQSSAG